MNKSHPKPPVTGGAAQLLPTLGLLPVLAISAGVAGPAQAQDTVTLDTVVIRRQQGNEAETSYKVTESTSDKATAPLLDTPRSVTVVTAREIEERGQTSVADVLRTTPGVTLGAGEGGVPQGVRPYIRGFEASQDLLIDGMRNASRTQYEAFNLESIEINKGPGGVYSGAGSTGGTISLNSKTPQPGAFDEVALSYGTGNYVRGTLDSNREFGALGLRLNLMGQRADDLGGRDGVESKRFGVAPSFSYRLTDDSKITAGLYYYKDEDTPDYGVPMSNATTPAEWRRGSGTRIDPFLPADVDPDTFYGLHARDFRDVESASGYLKFEHAFSDSLRLTTALRKARDTNTYVVTSPTSGSDGLVSRSSKASDRVNETVSFNAQLSGEVQAGGVEHSFAVGVDIANSRATTRRLTVVNPDPMPTSPYEHPDAGAPWGGSIERGGDTGYSTTKSRGIYALDTITFTPQWEATVGLRWDDYSVNSVTHATDENPRESHRNDSDFLNGMLGVVYKPAPNGSVYASVSSSSNPAGEGAGTGGSNASDDLDSLDPEHSVNYEIGTKWLVLNDQLQLSAALFRTEKDNARVTNSLGETENIGKTTAKGVELGFAGQITERWGIWGGYVYQDVKLKDGGWTTPRGGGDPYPNPGTGRQVVKIPRNSFSLWTTYDYSPELTLGGGVTYTGKRMASYSQNGDADAGLPSSWRTDLMAAYKLTEETALQFNVNNVFDRQIYTDSHSGQFANIEPGRNYVLTLKHAF
ncbi:TonB-dependent siderophore receptor [Paracoccus sp. MA]|uniref:TonB-dependent receptor n=1 Tax=Paracoccus sp. MA TaxID=2895796 RepID=UPI001E48A8F8|nr:TonB-dependent siderophore receptor [Paracoccus sp. MA]UFM63333.1 TonB-dependent siderophore receptor [Paracoccus sp. MA]